MKILLLAPEPFYVLRGTPIAVRALLEVLATHGGHQVDVLTYFEGEELSIPGVIIHRISRPPFVRTVPIGPSWQKIPCDAFMLVEAYRLLARGKYDVMHGVEDGAILASILSRVTSVPYVFDMDSHMSYQILEKSRLLWPLSKLFGLMEKMALRRALGVLAVCPALVEVASRYQSDVALLPDMPFGEGRTVEPSDEVVNLGGVRIVYVGNLESYQGIGLLLVAFQRISSRHPHARLVIVGGSSEDISEYISSVPDLVESGRVHFLGRRPLEQLRSILAASDILVSPRLKGVNTPMKVYSYLESGRPMLATRLPTHTQVVSEKEACLVEPDAESMAEGLSTLLKDRELRERLGRRGRKLVRTEYSRKRFTGRLTTFYERMEQKVHNSGIPETE